MKIADVNVLVSAFRPDAEHHAICRRWLEDVITGQEPFGVSPQALCSMVRVATHRQVFKTSSRLPELFAFCDNLLGQPHARVVQPGERHWGIFRQLCLQVEARGNLVPDVWYAALAIEQGCEWITMDRDFARFPGLKWSVPKLPA